MSRCGPERQPDLSGERRERHLVQPGMRTSGVERGQWVRGWDRKRWRRHPLKASTGQGNPRAKNIAEEPRDRWGWHRKGAKGDHEHPLKWPRGH
jgi:hypothetical protein